MSSAPIRVLYVDDDLALVRLVQKTLARRNIAVEPIADPAEAVARVAAGGADIVALDHYLSDTTGLELLKAFVALENPPPVIYVTGSSEMSVAVAALKIGAVDFVPKTVGDDFLVLLGSSIEQAVEKARLMAEKEAAQREVARARDRAELLLAEVNHRVANSLALAASMVQLQAKGTTSEEARHALQETQARITAIALVHQRLYTSGDVRQVALDEYLAGLLDHLAAMMRSEGYGAALVRSLEPIALMTDASVNLGIVVTEWVVNAFKYAYPNGAGEIRVRLARRADGQVELSVEDDGVGRGAGVANGTGLGTRIVKAVAATLRAEVAYLAGNPGTIARLIFPLQERATP